MSEKLCFLNTFRADPVEGLVSADKDLKIVSFSIEATLALRKAKVPFSHIDGLFPMKVHHKLDVLGQRLAGSWPEAFGEAMRYKGVPLGLCARTFFANYFFDGLKCFAIASNAIKEHRPEKVLCSPPLKYGLWSAGNTMPMYAHLPYVLEAVCKKENVAFEFLPIHENDQQFEKARETRPAFDLAVKGRNLLRGSAQKLKHMAASGKKCVFTIHLRPSLLDGLKPIAAELGLELIVYDQASDNFGSSGNGGHAATLSALSSKYEELKKDGKLLEDLPRHFLPLKEAMDVDFKFFIERSAPEMMREADNIGHALDAYHVDAMLCIDDFSPLDKVRVSVARSKGIVSCVVQHGVMVYRDWMNAFGPPYGDHNLVWGEGVKDIFIKGGFPAENIHATGLGQVDVIYAKVGSKDEVDRVRSEMGIPVGKKIVLWATMPAHINFTGKSLKVFEEEILGVYATMKARQDKEVLVVKPHPIEPLNYYNGLAEEAGFKPFIATSHLPELLEACDVLMANDSTVGVQALVVGKPFITLNTQVLKDICGFVENGVSVPVDDVKDLAKALDTVLYGDSTGLPKKDAIDRYLERYAAGTDGSGLRKILAKVAELAGKAKPG
jgi:hypothetical protein